MLLTSCTGTKNETATNNPGSNYSTNEPAQVKAANLMNEISAQNVTEKKADEKFISAQMAFSMDVFKKSVKDSGTENVLVSPLSVQTALAMTANGAKGETKTEMENVLAKGMSLNDLNSYLYTYRKSLTDKSESKLHIANSIWFRDDSERLDVNENFLQTNADYYGADTFKSSFDNSTVKDINDWVSNNTDKMIDKIVDDISVDTVMYLINALSFDAQWENEYKSSDIYDGKFTDFSDKSQDVKMMKSNESYYLEDENAKGFIKNYKNGEYSFAALLPNEDTDINTYIENMNSQDLLDTLKNKKETTVYTQTPKFSYDYSIVMNDLLSELGIKKAFNNSEADFSEMAVSSRGNIYIDNVLHKTFISVDEKGTKAGAATKVEMEDECELVLDGNEVILNRPFVFMIVDNSTNLPIFIGAVKSLE